MKELKIIKCFGIGGIAMAGIIGIIKSWGIIKSAVGLAAKEMGGKSNVEASVKRTQRDISMKIIAIGSIMDRNSLCRSVTKSCRGLLSFEWLCR